MGVVVAKGKGVSKLRAGDRLVVPLTIACGGCFFCGFDEVDDPVQEIIPAKNFRGIDASMDAVGFEAKGSTVSVPGAYVGFIHGFLSGGAFEKASFSRWADPRAEISAGAAGPHRRRTPES